MVVVERLVEEEDMVEEDMEEEDTEEVESLVEAEDVVDTVEEVK